MENRVLRAGLRGKCLRLSDDDRRRLAVKAQALGREALAQIASVATPATLLRWYRYVIAAKYDGSKNRSPGRPPTAKRHLPWCRQRDEIAKARPGIEETGAEGKGRGPEAQGTRA